MIRSARVSDAAMVAALSTELGYPSGAAVMEERLQRLLARDDQAVFVAELSGDVAGWLQAQATETLESGSRVEIVGLVVGDRFRRRGVGGALMARAEAWAAERGARAVVVRSNVLRSESHAFYQALGYAPTKTQAVYRLALPRPAGPSRAAP